MIFWHDSASKVVNHSYQFMKLTTPSDEFCFLRLEYVWFRYLSKPYDLVFGIILKGVHLAFIQDTF